MTLPALKQRGYTLEDWASWEGRWELIGGMAYPTYGMAPASSLDHQRINSRLLVGIFTALETLGKHGGGTCEVFTTQSKDWTGKRWAYEAAGIPEYLIVDPDERVGELLRLDAAGHYVSIAQVEWGDVVGLLGDSITIKLA